LGNSDEAVKIFFKEKSGVTSFPAHELIDSFDFPITSRAYEIFQKSDSGSIFKLVSTVTP
jgi:hypothetical protein